MGSNRLGITALIVALGFVVPNASANFQPTTPLPEPWAYHSAVSNDDFIYKLSGMSFNEGVCGWKTVLFAKVNANGTTGPWGTTTPLPALSSPNPLAPTCDLSVGGFGSASVYASSHIYVVGGEVLDSNGVQAPYYSSAVYSAAINSDGSLGAWNTSFFPIGIAFHAAAVWNGTIYITGGCTESLGPFTCITNTYFSRINPDGSLGPWQPGTPLPGPEGGTQGHASVAADGNIYISGGAPWQSTAPSGLTNAVYHAPLNSDGSIGAWQTDTPLIEAVAMHDMVERHGRVFVIGGFGGFGQVKSVYSSIVNPDGSLSNWTSESPLPIELFALGSARAKDTLISFGGVSYNAMEGGVYYNPDTTAPAPITDLANQTVNSSSIHLAWTATGNDGPYGAVEDGQFDIRYSVNPSDFSSFETIPNSLVLPANYNPGDPQLALLAGLAPGTTYYTAVESIDRAGNRSPASNVSSAMTFYVATSTEIPPRMKLESVFPSFNIQIVTGTPGSVALQTAPGTLVSSIYDITPSGTALNPPGIMTFSFDASVDPTQVAIYKYIDSTVGWSSASITNQVADATSLTISGRNPSTSIYALFALKKKPVETAVFNISVSPETLNLKSKGKWISVCLEAANTTSDVTDIDPKSLKLTAVNGSLINPIYSSGKSSIGDCNSNGITDLAVKFDRSSIESLLAPGQEILQFSGALRSGPTFKSSAVLRAIEPPNVNGSAGPVTKSSLVPIPPKLQRILELLRSRSCTPQDLIAILTDTTAAATVRKVSGPQRITVTIPDGAATDNLAVTVSTSFADSSPDIITRKVAAEAKKLVAIADPVQFGPEGTQFSKPVTLELPYDRTTLPPGFDENSLTIQYWNPITADWETLASSVDKQAQLVRAQTSHFSLYQLFGGGGTVQATPDASFMFRDAYAFPNPARGASNVVIRVQVGQADSVEVHIYDVTGRRIHASSDFTFNPSFDDLNGKGPQFTYAHSWDLSGVASGVYTYVITAKKAGSAEIHKTGKIGVIK